MTGMDLRTRPGEAYFWQRVPGWARRLAARSLAAAVVLVLLLSALTAWAQSATPAGQRYSLPAHVLAMTAVAALAVAVASGLIRLGKWELAAITAAGTAFGPMTLAAVPVRASLVTAASDDTALWWRALVALALTAVILTWAGAAARCLPPPQRPVRGLPSALAVDGLFAAVAVLGVVGYGGVPTQADTPVMRAVVGWALLAAGVATVAAFGSRWWVSPGYVLACAAALGLIVVAYARSGGWPGVAGWERDGMESPIVTCAESTVILLASGLLGGACYAILSMTRGRAATLPPTSTAP
ncbi:MAG TPA: hypothetical protein VMI11_00290 [Actinomycetes bacterium]|nr:hypothetical protein [Actinomycetes bacterium]